MQDTRASRAGRAFEHIGGPATLLLVGALLATAHGCSAASVGLRPPLNEPAELAARADRAGARADAAKHLSACFEGAYAQATTGAGCRDMDEEGKRVLAVLLTNCHLEASGRPFTPCAPGAGDSLRDCTSAMSAEQFGAFSEFTTHVDSLCYYVESRAWRAAAESIIARLLFHANDTAETLASVLAASDTLRVAQLASLDAQGRALNLTTSLVEHVHEAQESLSAYRGQLDSTLRDTAGSYAMVADAVRQVAQYSAAVLHLQGYVVSHLLAVQTLGFYLSAAGVAWAVSSPRRTADARLWLYLALILAAGLELGLASAWTASGGSPAEAAGAAGASMGARAAADAASGARDWHALLPSSFGVAADERATGAAVEANATTAGHGGWSSIVLVPLPVLGGACSWLVSHTVLPAWQWATAGGDGHNGMLRLSFDALSLRRWELSRLQWVVRYAYVTYALVLVLAHAFSYVDYSKINFTLLSALHAEVGQLMGAMRGETDRMRAFSAGQAASAARPGAGAGGAASASASSGGTATAPLGSFLATGWEKEDTGGGYDSDPGDSDYDPAAPDDLGPQPLWPIAGAPAADSAGHGAVRAALKVGASGQSPAGEKPQAGGAANSVRRLLGGALNSAAASSVVVPAEADVPEVPAHAHTYSLRPLGAAYRPNPVTAYESPAAFASLVHLKWMASAVHLYATVTAPAEAAEEALAAPGSQGLAVGREGFHASSLDLGLDAVDALSTGSWTDTSSSGTGSDNESDGDGRSAAMELDEASCEDDGPADSAAGTGLGLPITSAPSMRRRASAVRGSGKRARGARDPLDLSDDDGASVASSTESFASNVGPGSAGGGWRGGGAAARANGSASRRSLSLGTSAGSLVVFSPPEAQLRTINEAGADDAEGEAEAGAGPQDVEDGGSGTHVGRRNATGRKRVRVPSPVRLEQAPGDAAALDSEATDARAPAKRSRA
jgi:hypothetical protein